MIDYKVINPIIQLTDIDDFVKVRETIDSYNNTCGYNYDMDMLGDGQVQLIGTFEVNQLQDMFDEINGL